MASKTERTRFTPRLISLAVASCFATGAAYGQVLPTGAHATSGISSINTVGNTMTVTTNAARSIVNWHTFSIGSGATVAIQQPGATSANLNRVVGSGGAIDPSVILGTLQSNGRVFLLNPSGIVFGAGSQVDVAGLVASTLNLSNADFLGGRLNFTAVAGAGSVVNEGTINAATGGEVYLVGPSVTNKGVITSPKGEVILAAGNSVELVNPGTPNLRVEITAPENEARNLGSIVAEAGRVGIYAGLISHSGTIRADSAVATEDGRIILKATKNTTIDAGSTISASGPSGGQVTIQSGDTTLVSGSISATGSAGKGGTVQVLGNLVGLDDNASIDVSGETGGGTALVGGDFQGKNPNVQNAFRTYFGPNATIKADAIGNGDGGTVIVWSDDATRAYGTISARGGSQSGDGGFVEVSGKRWLDFDARVSTSAPKGRTGTLLLDPEDVCIFAVSSCGGCGGMGSFSGGGLPASGGTPSIFANGGGGESVISWTTIQGRLGENHVVITTHGTGSPGTQGNIRVIDDSPDLLSPNNLLLVAHNDVNIGGRIWNTSSGELRIYAGWDDALTPLASLAAASQAAFNSPASAVAVKQNVGNINVNANIDMEGNTSLFAGRDITVANGKTVTVYGSFGLRPSILSLNAGNAVTVNGGFLRVDVGGGGPRNSILQIVSGAGGITANGGNLLADNDTGGESRVALSTAGNISLQSISVGAEGGRGGIARVIMGANGSISIGNGPIRAAETTNCCIAPTGAAAQITLIGNSILIDNSSLEVMGGTGTTTGGAASLNLIAAAGMDLVGAAASPGFDPLSILPVGPITISGAEGIAIGGNGGTRGGDAAATILAGGPLAITGSFFNGMEARGGAGTGPASAGGNASTLLSSSTAGVTLTDTHIGSSGGSGIMTGGSAVTEISALGGDIAIDGSGSTELTFFAQGGAASALGGTGGTSEISTFSTGVTKVINDTVHSNSGSASQGRSGDANIFAIALGGFESLDATIEASAQFGGEAGGNAILSILAPNIRAESTSSGSESSNTLIARGGNTHPTGTPGSGIAVFVITSPTGSLDLVNERVEVSGGRLGSSTTDPIGGAGTILLFFNERTSGGFSVNGVEGAITGSPVGFFVNEQPAIPGTNFLTVYGGVIPPVIPPPEEPVPEPSPVVPAPQSLRLVVDAMNETARNAIPSPQESTSTKEEKDQKKKQTMCN